MTTATLDDLLHRYPPAVQTLARTVRSLLLKTLPDVLEAVDGSAPVIGYGYGTGYKSQICSLLLSKSGVKLGIAYGAAFPDPDHLLEGAGKVHRYVRITAADDLQKPGVERLIAASCAAARARLAHTPGKAPIRVAKTSVRLRER